LSSSVDGRWGLPVGRIINVKSKPSVGKTSFVLKIAREAQKRKGVIWFVESEHALDLEYMKRICRVEDLLISQPDTLEDALNTIELAVQTCFKIREEEDTSPFVIIMDSFSGFTTEGERGGGGGLGEHARLASMFCRKMTGPIKKAKAILIVIHQTKSKIGVTWGSPETSIGGDAFNFHGSITINLNRTVSVKDSSKGIIGHYGIAKTTKNKLFSPFREVKFKVINGLGFDRSFSIMDFLISNKSLVKKGAWFHIRGHKDLKFQGQENFGEFLRSSKKVRSLIKEALKA